MELLSQKEGSELVDGDTLEDPGVQPLLALN